MSGNRDADFQGYRLIEPLGFVEGCNVFKASSAQGNEFVAVKIFPVEISRNRSLLERLRSSFQSVAQYHHPNILRIKSFGVQAGRPYIVMPFMESGSLQDRIDCGYMAAIDTEEVLGDVVSALEFAHSRGLVHGNLRPSQILFDEEGNAQLNGLGESALIRFFRRQWNSGKEDSSYYQAPEVRAGGDSTPLADQYSLGIIALQMMTNHPVEVALSGLNLLKGNRSDQISTSNPFVLDIPKRMMAVLLQALSGDPSQRFPSVRVMYQAFVAALHNRDFRLETMPESRSKKKPEVQTKRQRSRLLVLAPIVALALVLVIALQVLSSGSDGLFSGLKSLFGLGQEENAVEVTMGVEESSGGIDLGAATVVKSPIVGDVSIKATDVVATPTITALPEDAAVNPPDPQASPAKTSPPNRPTETPSSPEQPTEMVSPTPTPTIMETATSTPTVAPTEISPTNTPVSGSPINPSACKTDPNHKLYCTPTPSS
jgi:serine/threonine protein kinase